MKDQKVKPGKQGNMDVRVLKVMHGEDRGKETERPGKVGAESGDCE